MNDAELLALLEKLPKSVLYVSAGLVFLPCYIYCIATYGFLWGVGLGWLPSAIVTLAVAVPISALLRRLIIWYDPVVRENIRRRKSQHAETRKENV